MKNILENFNKWAIVVLLLFICILSTWCSKEKKNKSIPIDYSLGTLHTSGVGSISKTLTKDELSEIKNTLRTTLTEDELSAIKIKYGVNDRKKHLGTGIDRVFYEMDPENPWKVLRDNRTFLHLMPPPQKFSLDPASEKTFNEAGPGTGFTAIADIYTGTIYFAPLESDGRTMPQTIHTWETAKVSTFDGHVIDNKPILHNSSESNNETSHLQLAKRIYHLNDGSDPQKHVVGFAVTRGRNGGIYYMGFTSRSSQGAPLIDIQAFTEKKEQELAIKLGLTDLKNLNAEQRKQLFKLRQEIKSNKNYSTFYKFVAAASPGQPMPSHMVEYLPAQWAIPIIEYLREQLGTAKKEESPNVFTK